MRKAQVHFDKKFSGKFDVLFAWAKGLSPEHRRVIAMFYGTFFIFISAAWKAVTSGSNTCASADFAKKTILSDNHILYCPSFLKLSSFRKLFKIKERKFTHCK